MCLNFSGGEEKYFTQINQHEKKTFNLHFNEEFFFLRGLAENFPIEARTLSRFQSWRMQ